MASSLYILAPIIQFLYSAWLFHGLGDSGLVGKLGGSGVTPIQTRPSYPCNLVLISQHLEALTRWHS